VDAQLLVAQLAPTAGSTNVERPGYARMRQMPLDLWCKAVRAHVQMTHHQWTLKQMPLQVAERAASPVCTTTDDTHPRCAVEGRGMLQTAVDNCPTVQNMDQSANSEHLDP